MSCKTNWVIECKMYCVAVADPETFYGDSGNSFFFEKGLFLKISSLYKKISLQNQD